MNSPSLSKHTTHVHDSPSSRIFLSNWRDAVSGFHPCQTSSIIYFLISFHMSINNPYHDKNENQHRDRLDEINNYPPEYKKEYDLLSEEEKQKRWSLLFNSEAYNIAH